MTLDNNPVSTNATIKVLNEINTQQNAAPQDKQVKLSIHDNSNFRDAAGTISNFIIDIVIINISSIDIDKYKEDCIQLRSIYSFAPIIAITNSNSTPNLNDYNYIGFDDILSIDSITPNTLLRAVLSAIQRSKNYHSFHTSNQRKLINNKLLKLLLEKNDLTSVAESACKIINSKNSNSSSSSASIYTVHDDKVDCIGHSGTTDSEDTNFEYQKEIYTLKHSGEFNDEFNFLKSKSGDRTRFTIPLNNKNSTFAFLKIDTEYGIVHPSEERVYYKDMSDTLAEILLLAQEREHFEQLNQQNTRLIDEMSSAAVGINKHDQVTHWNHQAEIYFGIEKSEAINKRLFHLNIICDWPVIISKLYDSLNNSKIIEKFEVSYKRNDKEKDRILSIAITPFTEPNGSFIGYLLLMDDITEKKHLEKAHQQSMYLESIGQLSAGIAHEINTPMQYISDNLNFLKDSFNDVARAITHIKKSLLDKTLDEAKLDSIYEEADIEYLNKELPLAFSQTTDGVERVCSIVKAMKEYSHPNSEEKVATNINHCIESTITISKHTWKYHSDMEVILDPNLPDVMCHPGPFNEVILNIVVNAADAIKERVEKDETIDKGKITIETIKKENCVEIRISDTGGGIPKSIQEKIFDPFFTTKSVGKGTGQGLALSYSIIKERHNGELQFETVPGESTTFIIQLPYSE
jgi:PAS domain S-box-containing protein